MTLFDQKTRTMVYINGLVVTDNPRKPIALSQGYKLTAILVFYVKCHSYQHESMLLLRACWKTVRAPMLLICEHSA